MKPKQFYLVLLVIFFLTILSGILGFTLINSSINTKLNNYHIELAKISLADETLDNLVKLHNQYDKITPLIPKLYAVLPNTKQQSEVIVQLQQIARNSGLTINGISFLSTSSMPSSISQTQKTSSGFLALPINLQLVGSYEQLHNFLQQIENLNRYISISTLTINRNEGKNTILTINLTANAFLKP